MDYNAETHACEEKEKAGAAAGVFTVGVGVEKVGKHTLKVTREGPDGRMVRTRLRNKNIESAEDMLAENLKNVESAEDMLAESLKEEREED